MSGSSHWHDPRAPTQNSGNRLGERPCVRLSDSYFKQFSGDAAAEFTGGPATERIPEGPARHNPLRPVDFSTPPRSTSAMAIDTPPRRDVEVYQEPAFYRVPERKDEWSSPISIPVRGGGGSTSHNGEMTEMNQYRYGRSEGVVSEMEENLIRWAEKMGIPNPRTNATPSARQGWPKGSSWDEPSYVEHARPNRGMAGEAWCGNGYGGAYDGKPAMERPEPAMLFTPDPRSYQSADYPYDAGKENYYYQSGDDCYSFAEVPEGQRERSASMEFHQRSRMKHDLREKLEAGNGDIITWNNVG